MSSNGTLKSFQSKLNAFRHSLAYIDALPQLTALGLLIGLFTGAIIAIFRLLIELPMSQFLPIEGADFESLSPHVRVFSILAGGILIMAIFYCVKPQCRDISVAHVIDRLHNHQGSMPIKNWLVQFFGAIVCVLSGQSVGREGPAVHLGAGAASQLGQWLKLPNNSMSTLIACGVASAISTSFNTPLAGVVFAMEVIVREYTIIGFVPVILASVIGAVMNQIIFPGEQEIQIEAFNLSELTDLPYMAVVGLGIAVLAAIFTKLNIFTLRFKKHPLFLRISAAVTLTALASIIAPEVMGLGYDTINQAANHQLALATLALIVLCKLTVSPIVVALGIPGGVIGPSLLIGGCAGALFGSLIDIAFVNQSSDAGFYVLIGMAGMMAAVLNAPLAALIAVLELSYNPNLIFPAMLVIVIACVTTRHVFRVDGIFIEQLRHSGREIDFGPAKQALARAGVRSVMNANTVSVKLESTIQELMLALRSKPDRLLYEHEKSVYAVIAADVAKHLNNLEESQARTQEQNSAEQAIELVNLHKIAARREPLEPISEAATLLEALHLCQRKNLQTLYVTPHGPTRATQARHLSQQVLGVISVTNIENYYRPKDFSRAVV